MLERITSLRISEEDLKYCKDNGLSLSFLLRQAITAHKLKDSVLKSLEIKNG